jgi:hypothetical protein
MLAIIPHGHEIYVTISSREDEIFDKSVKLAALVSGIHRKPWRCPIFPKKLASE